jgi:hypothetical protein
MWELGVPVASERRDALSKLAMMAAAPEGRLDWRWEPLPRP